MPNESHNIRIAAMKGSCYGTTEARVMKPKLVISLLPDVNRWRKRWVQVIIGEACKGSCTRDYSNEYTHKA
jgi:hypothetical protein